jgi:spermidine synthase
VDVIEEPLAPGLTRHWELGDVKYRGTTAFQRVVIASTAQGLALFCDDERQSAELSQLWYHEALIVPALLLADTVDEVLVVGCSEGVACQIAADAGAKRVDHVDIDREVVELCAEHLPYGYDVDELRRAEKGQGPVWVHYDDGFEFLASAAAEHRRYDVIAIDLPDERDQDAQHNRLYTTEFLRRCREVLAPGGVVVSQAGCPTLWRNQTLREASARFDDAFPTVAYYGSDEHEWSFLFGRADPVRDATELMVERLESSLYRPKTIDADALRGCSVRPHSLRSEQPAVV